MTSSDQFDGDTESNRVEYERRTAKAVPPLPGCSCGKPKKKHFIPKKNFRYRNIHPAFGPVYPSEDSPIRALRGCDSLRTVCEDDLEGMQNQSNDRARWLLPGNRYCALYFTNSDTGPWYARNVPDWLFDRCFAAWFHHGTKTLPREFLARSYDLTRVQQFKAMEVCQEKTRRQLGELVEFHKRLCALIDANRAPNDGLCRTRKFLPSFKKCFLLADVDKVDSEGMALVVLSTKRIGAPGWVYEQAIGASWWKGPIGQVLERFLEQAGLSPSAHPEIMHTGRPRDIPWALSDSESDDEGVLD